MASPKVSVVILLVSLLAAAHFLEAVMASEDAQATPYKSATINCGSECARRCQYNRRPNLCHRACGTCCYRCKCVPPGTYGNQEMCGPCYARMTTHGGRLKCP